MISSYRNIRCTFDSGAVALGSLYPYRTVRSVRVHKHRYMDRHMSLVYNNGEIMRVRTSSIVYAVRNSYLLFGVVYP